MKYNYQFKDDQTVRVGFDIDGVLAAFGEHFLDYLGFQDKSPALSWDDPRFMENMHLLDNDEEFWLTIPTLEDPRLIDYPVAGYFTARNIPSDVTAQWLLINHFPDAPVITVGLEGSKVQSLKESGIELYIDDAIRNYEEVTEAGIRTYLKTRSHNFNYPAAFRVDTLGEFREEVIKFQKLKIQMT
jgi:uncharacterized HAD superfamily protein